VGKINEISSDTASVRVELRAEERYPLSTVLQSRLTPLDGSSSFAPSNKRFAESPLTRWAFAEIERAAIAVAVDDWDH
jgi:hypothetical protein